MSRRDRPDEGSGRRLGLARVAAATPTAASAWASWSARRRSSGRRSSAFVNVDQVLKDATVIADSARGRALTVVQTGAEPAEELFTRRRRRAGFRLDRPAAQVRQAERRPARRPARRARRTATAKSDEWLLMFVAGMWFQDLWTYDFRRTEMCIIPYATQMGEISFCAYNTGRRLAADRREHVPERESGGLVHKSTANMPCMPTPTRQCRCQPTRGRSHCTSRKTAAWSSGRPAAFAPTALRRASNRWCPRPVIREPTRQSPSANRRQGGLYPPNHALRLELYPRLARCGVLSDLWK